MELLELVVTGLVVESVTVQLLYWVVLQGVAACDFDAGFGCLCQ